MLCYCFDLCYGIQWFVLRLLKSVFQNSRQALSFFYFAPECPLSIQRKMWSRLWPQTGCLRSIGLYFTPSWAFLLKIWNCEYFFDFRPCGSLCILSEVNLSNSHQSRLWVNMANLCILGHFPFENVSINISKNFLQSTLPKSSWNQHFQLNHHKIFLIINSHEGKVLKR